MEQTLQGLQLLQCN